MAVHDLLSVSTSEALNSTKWEQYRRLLMIKIFWIYKDSLYDSIILVQGLQSAAIAHDIISSHRTE
jgi:hypothetical protein